jgi:hypothetical protein
MIELIFYCALISCYVHVHLNCGPQLLSFFETINYAAMLSMFEENIIQSWIN